MTARELKTARCDYCGGKGWCWLPYSRMRLPVRWEGGGPPGEIITFEKCYCPICNGLGLTLFPVGHIGEWIKSKWLYKEGIRNAA